jgi:hypothetical protein
MKINVCGRVHLGRPIPVANGYGQEFEICSHCGSPMSLEQIFTARKIDVQVKHIVVAAHIANVEDIKRRAR